MSLPLNWAEEIKGLDPVLIDLISEKSKEFKIKDVKLLLVLFLITEINEKRRYTKFRKKPKEMSAEFQQIIKGWEE